MPIGTIVVMEDDETLRLLITSILKKHDYLVFAAPNGQAGLEMVRRVQPDLVLSDVQMPILDGLGMLAQLREDPEIASVPVVLLTSLGERANIRTGMSSGADDYLTKPFLPQELTEAVQAQLRKRSSQTAAQTTVVNNAVKTALDSQRNSLATIYERRLKRELSGSLWDNQGQHEQDEVHASATVMYLDLINPKWPQLLNPTELTTMLKLAYTSATDTVNLFGARHTQMVGEGLLAVFVSDNDTASVNHAVRAFKSAFALVKSASRVQRHLDDRFTSRQLPPFQVGVALHSGPVTIAKINDPLRFERTVVLPVGETIKITVQLQQRTTHARCPVIASEAAIKGNEAAVVAGRQAAVDLRGDGVMFRVAELLGMRDSPGQAN